ncbi:MAG: hypothetical protein COW84_07685 [Gammaproteobacteria bacterium CG22_combo_CG10-13_8_21_14_all_40_8]|nr:MAG: hypothetical protein COW84_07685 [Gammaproteobacteria bacterium CG22_combo_CG10-13_8_21_14_all_40_8]
MNRKSPLFATYNKNIVIKILYLSLLSWILLPMIASASEVGPTFIFIEIPIIKRSMKPNL